MKISNPTKYNGKEEEYIKKVLDSDNLSSTSGSFVNEFEKQFSEYVEVKYSVASNSGTSALHQALNALGVSRDDKVIIPALSVFMSATSVYHCGAHPIYVDVREDNFIIDLDKIKEARQKHPGICGIVIVNLYGLYSTDYIAEIVKYAHYNGMFVIEDNAQCLFRKMGILGDIATYSLENSKILSVGEGGVICTNSERLAESCRKFGNHGFKNSTAKEGRTRLNDDEYQSPDYFRHDDIGWGYRLSEVCGALALAQLERADELVMLRRANADIMRDAIRNADFLMEQVEVKGDQHSYWIFGCLFDEKMAHCSWHDFRRNFIEKGGDGFYGCWKPVFLEPAIANRSFLKFVDESKIPDDDWESVCPVAVGLQKRMIQFKTNYRSLQLAVEKASALNETILRMT